MKLMTKEIEDKLAKSPIGSTDARGKDSEVIVKYFNPIGAGTWLITEGEKQEDGYCYISKKKLVDMSCKTKMELSLKSNC